MLPAPAAAVTVGPNDIRSSPLRRIVFLALTAVMVLSTLPSSAAEYHIVNGGPADPGEYPWMAALQAGEAGCGASVVANGWLLTAAHCTYVDEANTIELGPEGYEAWVNTNTYGQGERLTVAEVIRHPEYDPGPTVNDIALLRTNEPISVAPIRLATPAQTALNAPPTQATVIGYGTTETGQGSDTLLEVDIPVVADDDARCANEFPDRILCAGEPGPDGQQGRDSCTGDSGGPLFSAVDGELVQFGVVSFGLTDVCAVDRPGYYAQVTSFHDWINTTTGGAINQGPTPPVTPPVTPLDRIVAGDGNDPVDQAIAMSRAAFPGDGSAAFGVLAASANFPDALGGSALAAYLGTLLYVNEGGQLEDATLAELQRTVPAGGTVYVLGGTAVIGEPVVQALEGAGFEVRRLGGNGRQETARLVADEVLATVNEGQGAPFDAAIVAFEGNWPDAVGVGQLSAYWGIPILLTPTGTLGGPAAAHLQETQPARVYVIGGEAVVAQSTVEEIEAITGTGSVTRLGGPTRLATTAAVTTEHRRLLGMAEEVFGEPAAPELVIAVNLRRGDAFAHVLAAAPLAAQRTALFAPLEAEDGSAVDRVVLDSICGVGVPLIAAGGAQLVPDAVGSPLMGASNGDGCTRPQLGSS